MNKKFETAIDAFEAKYSDRLSEIFKIPDLGERAEGLLSFQKDIKAEKVELAEQGTSGGMKVLQTLAGTAGFGLFLGGIGGGLSVGFIVAVAINPFLGLAVLAAGGGVAFAGNKLAEANIQSGGVHVLDKVHGDLLTKCDAELLNISTNAPEALMTTSYYADATISKFQKSLSVKAVPAVPSAAPEAKSEVAAAPVATAKVRPLTNGR